MSSSNNKILKGYLFFYLFYVIVITFSKFTSYDKYPYVHLIYEMTVILSILINLIFLYIVRNNTHYKNSIDYFIILTIIIVLLLRFFAHIQLVTFPLLAIYLFIANLRYVNLHRFIKYDFTIKLLLIILIVTLYLLHLTPYEPMPVRHGLLRFSAGFSVYSGFANAILCLIFSYVLLMGKKIYKIRYILIIMILSLYVYRLTQSRGLLYPALIIMGLLILHRFSLLKNLCKWILLGCVIICPVLSVLIPVKISVGSSTFYYFNGFTSNRLAFQHMATQYYPIKFTGYPDMTGSNSSWLAFYNNYNDVSIDNTYLMLTLVCGIIGLFVFVFILARSCYISMHYNDYLLCVILIAAIVYMMIEVSFYYIDFYAPIIYAFMLNNYRKIKSHNKYNQEEN